MNLSHLLKNHPSFSLGSEISTLCKPLSLLNIPYFSHVHLDSQHRMSFFVNYPEFTRYYLEQGYYHYDLHQLKPASANQYFVWDLVERKAQSRAMHEDFKAFGRAHTFTIIKAGEQGSDFFHFAAKAGDYFMNQRYLEILEALEHFIAYYRDKLSQDRALQQASQLKLSLSAEEGGYLLRDSVVDPALAAFYQSTPLRRHYVSNSDYLTPGEIKCLNWLSQGKTLEETAVILSLSLRTVKAHVQSAKSKLNCNNLFQLGKRYSEHCP